MSKNKKIIIFLSKNFHFHCREKSLYIAWTCFRNAMQMRCLSARHDIMYVMQQIKQKNELYLENKFDLAFPKKLKYDIMNK